ncbi:MAG: HlyD family efflux transporter periplasmic adaptor subunit [Nitrospirota bacterium]|nr:HlyD family efflux transporter periplasmic adaptor subunit [Nitrospirota bacterium]MDH5767626.1 HlyD family efflux transporter periplasmic adaptor subunit [Nitrospirota bacterium]
MEKPAEEKPEEETFFQKLMKKKIVYLIPILLFLLVILVFVKSELTLTGYTKLFPHSEVFIRPEISGILKEIYIKEGDIVKKGDLLVKLLDDDIALEISKLQSRIKSEEWELKRLVEGPLPEEIKALEAEIEAVNSKKIYLEKELDRIEKLWKERVSPEAEYDQIKKDLSVTKAQLLEKQNRLALLKMGERVEIIEAKRARIEELKTKFSYLKIDLERTNIRSPIDGTVTTAWVHLKKGEYIDKGKEILRIEAIDKLLAEIPISDKDVTYVKIGQKVAIRLSALPFETFSGEVISIAPKTTKVEKGKPKVMVYSLITNKDSLIKSETNCFAKIYCGKYSLGHVLFRGIIRFFRVEFWTLW